MMHERTNRRQRQRLRKGQTVICRLSDLKSGQSGQVVEFRNDNKALRRRLLDMGITRGTTIFVKKVAPLGDPVDVYLRGYELCLRRKDMDEIDVRVVS